MERVLERLKALLPEADEDLLKFVAEAAVRQILNYINHDELPQELETAAVLISRAYWSAAGFDGSAQTVTAVKRGDVQTSFAVGSGSSGSAGTFNLGNDNGDFFGWKTVLNEYRKLRW